MLTHLTDTLTILITNLYVTTGLVGILLAMAIESCCIPLPSEIVMPLAGVMLASGKILHGMSFGVSLALVALAGSLGCVIGSTVAYAVGYSGGRPLLLKYGRYLLISQHDADRADHFFQKWGSATAFFSRLLPVVRTYISLPAGISRMPFVKFILYTFLGSLPWCLVLAYAGYQLGSHLNTLGPIFHGLDVVIVFVVVVLAVLYVWRHIRNDRKARAAHAAGAAGATGAAQPQMTSADAWNQAQQWRQQPPSQPQQAFQQPQQFSQGWGQPQGQPGWGQPQPQAPLQPSQPQQPSQPMSWQAQQGWDQSAPPPRSQSFQQWSQQPSQPQAPQGWGQPMPPQQFPQPQPQQQGWGQSMPQQQSGQPFQSQPQQAWGQPMPSQQPPQSQLQQGWGQPVSQQQPPMQPQSQQGWGQQPPAQQGWR